MLTASLGGNEPQAVFKNNKIDVVVSVDMAPSHKSKTHSSLPVLV